MFSWLFRKHGIIIQTAEYSMQYRECVPLDGRTENRRSVPWEGENSLFSSCLQIWCVGSTEIFIQDLCRSKDTRVWRTIYLHLVGYSFLYLTHLTYKGYMYISRYTDAYQCGWNTYSSIIRPLLLDFVQYTGLLVLFLHRTQGIHMGNFQCIFQ